MSDCVIPDEAKVALRDFNLAIRQMGLSCLIVGAGARLLSFDWRYDVPTGRSTTDWDFAVQVDGWSEYRNLLNHLCDAENSLFRRDNSEHRCIHISTGIAIDIVPFGAIDKPDEIIVWPGTQSQMNVAGYEEAFAHAEIHQIGEVCFNVLTIPAFVALKLFAWHDRKADKDLRDIDYLLRHYLDTNMEQIYQDLGSLLEEGSLEFEMAGPFHLGWKLASIFQTATREKLVEVIGEILDNQDRYLPGLMRGELSEENFDRHFGEVVERLTALLQGVQHFEAARPAS